ncbi:hypothetical protein KIPB_012606, partial [Kipferlia bialata]|eukprot:g12606.t1
MTGLDTAVWLERYHKDSLTRVAAEEHILVRSLSSPPDETTSLPPLVSLGLASDYQALLELVTPRGLPQVLTRERVDGLRRQMQRGGASVEQPEAKQSQPCGHCASRDREVDTLRQQVKDLRANGTSQQSAPNTSSGTDTPTRGGPGQGGVPASAPSTEERVKDVRQDTARRVCLAQAAMGKAPKDQAAQLKKQLDATIQDLSRVSLLKIQRETALKERVASLQRELDALNQQSSTDGPSDRHAASVRSESRVRGGPAGPSASGATDHTQSLRAEISTLRSQVHALTNDKAALQHQVSDGQRGYTTLHTQAQALTRRLTDMTREKERLEYKWGGKVQKLREAEDSARQAEKKAREWSAYADRVKTQLEQAKRENQEMRDKLQEGAHREQKVKPSDGVYDTESANPTSLQFAYSAMLTTTLASIKAGIKVKRKTPEWEELAGGWLDLVGEWKGNVPKSHLANGIFHEVIGQ